MELEVWSKLCYRIFSLPISQEDFSQPTEVVKQTAPSPTNVVYVVR